MNKIYEAARNNPLWNGIGHDDFEKMFRCIGAGTRRYAKGDMILLAGDAVKFIGLVLSGGVKIIREDADGNVTIMTELGVSEIFGEVFACAGIGVSPVTVRASEDCEILFINYKKVITSCASACGFHSKLIENMLGILAKKNLMLNQKIEVLSKRTIREKLLTFFDAQRGSAKKFSIPYNREELAHLICADRSATSNELCKMRDEGLIKFRKNEFEIYT